MAKGAHSIVVTINLKWWFVYIYMPALISLNRSLVDYVDTDYEINHERFNWWLKKAATFKTGENN